MILKGESSGAEAKVTSRRLITDRVGTVIGSYRVPSSDDPSAPTFETGRSMLRLTSSSTNSKVPGVVTTVQKISSIQEVIKTIPRKNVVLEKRKGRDSRG